MGLAIAPEAATAAATRETKIVLANILIKMTWIYARMVSRFVPSVEGLRAEHSQGSTRKTKAVRKGLANERRRGVKKESGRQPGQMTPKNESEGRSEETRMPPLSYLSSPASPTYTDILQNATYSIDGLASTPPAPNQTGRWITGSGDGSVFP